MSWNCGSGKGTLYVYQQLDIDPYNYTLMLWKYRTASDNNAITFGYATDYTNTADGGQYVRIGNGTTGTRTETTCYGSSSAQTLSYLHTSTSPGWLCHIARGYGSAPYQKYDGYNYLDEASWSVTRSNDMGSATWASPANPIIYVSSYSTWSGARFRGYVAHLAIWDAAISDANAASLYAGASPLAISDTANLLCYWPLTTNDANLLVDTQNSYTFTEGASGAFNATNPPVDDPPSGGFNITSVGGDDAVYPGETNAVLSLDQAATLSSVTISDGVASGEPQTITSGGGTATQYLTIARGDNAYNKDHNGSTLGARTQLTLTASE